MKTSFAALRENLFSRKFGGLTGTADPYTSGYGFTWFDRLPRALGDYVSLLDSNITSLSEVQLILSASCLSVTPVGGTLAKVELPGLGGLKWAVPGNIDYGNEISIKFLEFNKVPILNIFHAWIKMIRDYRTGATDLIDGDQGDGYSMKTFGCLIYYWTTAPDGVSVEYFVCYDGCFPLKDPQDLYSFDIESIARLDVEIPFHVDYAYREPWVLNYIKGIQEQFVGSKELVKTYGGRR